MLTLWAMLAGAAVGGMSMGWLGGLLWAQRGKPEPLLVPASASLLLSGDRCVYRGAWCKVTGFARRDKGDGYRDAVKVRWQNGGEDWVWLDEFKAGAMRPEREAERLLRLGPKIPA